ncbi:DUF2218 domain-containing protein [Stutzerimonas stutzeri]|uniref:DUF2218 domain-containing protein n=1 Tax=Stutzerimonas stutzeri TaxID=316 RepID=UPI003721C6C1
MYQSRASVSTPNAERLIKRLSNHWRHKFPVQLSPEGADIELPIGTCSLHNTQGGLQVTLKASEDEQLQRMQTVVADHLQRMGNDEALAFDWQP